MLLQNFILELAHQNGAVDKERCAEVVQQSFQQQQSAIMALLEANLVEEKEFMFSISTNLQLPWWDEDTLVISPQLQEQFPIRLAVKHCLLPFEDEQEQLTILTCDPFNISARQAVSRQINRPLRWGIARRSRIINCLKECYGVGADTFEQILAEGGGLSGYEEVTQETTNLDEDDSEASVARFVNQIIREALEQRATDIHIEPIDEDLRIRYRIDSVLHEVPVPPQIKLLKATLISRLKIMAHLDIAERRLPQDGRINLELGGQAIDVRIATIPSVAGESVSLRLLGSRKFTLQQLGLGDHDKDVVEELLALPNGIILLTGPTGCGKSTSLYTFLSNLNTKDRRIVTIEDPVEYKLPGVIQIAVKPEINLSFATGLRSILRGDPNVIMVGEMRDVETAETAIRAALTGHLVFSTLHTNDAVGGITRLIDMGVEPFLVSSSVRAFIAQRLVRILCDHCKKPQSYSADYLDKIGFPVNGMDQAYAAEGCEKCRFSGYQGRTALLEVCRITDAIQELIQGNATASEIRTVAIREGMKTLRQAGFIKVQSGMTTIEEVLRVTMEDAEEDLLEEAKKAESST
ncbi:MAG: GspE/PulE family protein [Verrucomicrobiota bacterium]